MDKSDPQNHAHLQMPMEMPVSELLTGTYHFSIPSYQRGYRWESSIGPNDNEIRQVDDLLNDLTHFVEANANNKANYYLQPLMVKPQNDNGKIVWGVLDGQQRLTTLLLILKCLNDKLCQNAYPLYTIEYANRPDIDFGKISFDQNSLDYDYPKPNKNLDSFFVRKAKDRIEDWYANKVTTQQKKDKLKEALFYEDSSRIPSSTPNLRVLFIWYNAEPLKPTTSSPATVSIANDIAIFNQLNGGKITLTNSELLKALFFLCIKVDRNNKGCCYTDEETLVRKWDEMERKFQDNEFWNMISPKNRTYENRLDFLFDFIRESDSNAATTNSYRYYYNEMKQLLTTPDSAKLEDKWEEITKHFDVLCKWHENITLHNYIGFLIDCGMSAAGILKEFKKSKGSTSSSVEQIVKGIIRLSKADVEDLRYKEDESVIRKLLLLFNVETSVKHNERFSFDKYRDRKYDIEHINSQTDNAIVNPDERIEWIEDQALASLNDEKNPNHPDLTILNDFIKRGGDLQKQGKGMNQADFNAYRQDLEAYFAHGTTISKYEKDWIGNLTLLNSSINREYQNALFPQKLRTIKRNDQEGEFIPPCTRYLFMKYYSDIKGNPSAFTMMRWRDEDQEDYYKAIINTLDIFIS